GRLLRLILHKIISPIRAQDKEEAVVGKALERRVARARDHVETQRPSSFSPTHVRPGLFEQSRTHVRWASTHAPPRLLSSLSSLSLLACSPFPRTQMKRKLEANIVNVPRPASGTRECGAFSDVPAEIRRHICSFLA